VRELGALGCGLILDTKAVKSLSNLLNDPVMEVRLSAILALSRIGSKSAMEAIAATLLSGNEDMRRAAAESLSMQPEEGYPALEEGSQMEDLLVRRATVYGLARIDEPWARERLNKLQVEDEQWVVRSAATQTLEELSRPNLRIPQPHPPLAQTPWLIAFAGTLGVGIAPGKPAWIWSHRPPRPARRAAPGGSALPRPARWGKRAVPHLPDVLRRRSG
jgi:hypothetical protein